ncbi:hypothetical protein Q7P36_003199 [Cladosporium allicinum]
MAAALACSRLKHKPISPPSLLLSAAARHTRHRTAHQSSTDAPPPRQASPSPAPTLRPPARKERAPNALVADRDSHCSLTAQERTASTATRAKRGRLGPPTPYSSSCSGSQRSCFQPLTSNFTPAPLLPPTKTPTRPHPRAHPHRRSTIALPSSTVRRPQLPSRARINPCHLRAHRPDGQSRERKHPGASIHPAQIASASPYPHDHGGGSSPAPQTRE